MKSLRHHTATLLDALAIVKENLSGWYVLVALFLMSVLFAGCEQTSTGAMQTAVTGSESSLASIAANNKKNSAGCGNTSCIKYDVSRVTIAQVQPDDKQSIEGEHTAVASEYKTEAMPTRVMYNSAVESGF